MLPLFPPSRALEVTHGLQRAVLRLTRSACAPGTRAPAKSARAVFKLEPIRDADAKEVRQAFVLLLEHWKHAQLNETHAVGWYAARLGLGTREIERYYVVLGELAALSLHQPPQDAHGVPRGPSGHPYNLTTWVMGMSAKKMRQAAEKPTHAPRETRDTAPRSPRTEAGNAVAQWALRLVQAPDPPS